jgi:hypothetical protein
VCTSQRHRASGKDAQTSGNTHIYPNEVIDLIRFKFEIKQSDLEDVLDNVEVEFKIFHPDGEDTIIINLKEVYSKLKKDRV